ncbi:MAG TPA: hypothetical protein EYQ00_08465 [Dehalococcoidia bacterium]|jgi:hypothetical protein|nr:hypothetical protein [Dehalococcoidia bacterium]
MSPGNLVRNIEPYHEDHINRNIGTVISFDCYGRNKEQIVEILWCSGEIDWILRSRLEVINEAR